MIRRKLKKLMTKTFLVGALLGAMLSAALLIGCTDNAGPEGGRDSDRATMGQSVSEGWGGESGGEHGSGGEGSESAGEGAESGGESGSEGGGGSAEIGEAAMSGPIIPLGETWNGVLGGLAASMQYDAAAQTVHGTVRNTLSQKLCYVQAEPHLKSGTATVGELGPEKLGDLNPGQEATTSLSVAGEPELAGVSYDGYVIHLEVFDCAGPGPVPHTGGEGGEQGSGESGTESGSESGGERRGGQRQYAGAGRDFRCGSRRRPADPELRRCKQFLQGHGGKHDQGRPGPGQDRSAPLQRNGAGSDDPQIPRSRRNRDGHPPCDAGVVHRMGGPRRGWFRQRGEWLRG